MFAEDTDSKTAMTATSAARVNNASSSPERYEYAQRGSKPQSLREPMYSSQSPQRSPHHHNHNHNQNNNDNIDDDMMMINNDNDEADIVAPDENGTEEIGVRDAIWAHDREKASRERSVAIAAAAKQDQDEMEVELFVEDAFDAIRVFEDFHLHALASLHVQSLRVVLWYTCLAARQKDQWLEQEARWVLIAGWAATKLRVKKRKYFSHCVASVQKNLVAVRAQQREEAHAAAQVRAVQSGVLASEPRALACALQIILHAQEARRAIAQEEKGARERVYCQARASHYATTMHELDREKVVVLAAREKRRKRWEQLDPFLVRRRLPLVANAGMVFVPAPPPVEQHQQQNDDDDGDNGDDDNGAARDFSGDDYEDSSSPNNPAAQTAARKHKHRHHHHHHKRKSSTAASSLGSSTNSNSHRQRGVPIITDRGDVPKPPEHLQYGTTDAILMNQQRNWEPASSSSGGGGGKASERARGFSGGPDQKWWPVPPTKRPSSSSLDRQEQQNENVDAEEEAAISNGNNNNNPSGAAPAAAAAAESNNNNSNSNSNNSNNNSNSNNTAGGGANIRLKRRSATPTTASEPAVAVAAATTSSSSTTRACAPPGNLDGGGFAAGNENESGDHQQENTSGPVRHEDDEW